MSFLLYSGVIIKHVMTYEGWTCISASCMSIWLISPDLGSRIFRVVSGCSVDCMVSYSSFFIAPFLVG